VLHKSVFVLGRIKLDCSFLFVFPSSNIVVYAISDLLISQNVLLMNKYHYFSFVKKLICIFLKYLSYLDKCTCTSICFIVIYFFRLSYLLNSRTGYFRCTIHIIH